LLVAAPASPSHIFVPSHSQAAGRASNSSQPPSDPIPPPSSHLVIVVGSELPSAGSVAPITQEAPRGRPRCPPCRAASGRCRVTGGRVQQCRRRRSPHFSARSVGTWMSARRWSPRHRHHARPHQRGVVESLPESAPVPRPSPGSRRIRSLRHRVQPSRASRSAGRRGRRATGILGCSSSGLMVTASGRPHFTGHWIWAACH
jgi:hypothetical protein